MSNMGDQTLWLRGVAEQNETVEEDDNTNDDLLNNLKNTIDKQQSSANTGTAD